MTVTVFPKLPVEKLREITADILAGNIFTSAQVRDPSVLSMVFMPLMFGAYCYEPNMPVEPEPPVAPVQPTPPPVREFRDREHPELTATLELTKKALEKAEFQFSWGYISEGLLEEKRAEALAAEEAIENLLGPQRRKFEQEVEEEARNYAIAMETYNTAKTQYDAAYAAYVVACNTYDSDLRLWSEGETEWNSAREKDFGVFYSYMKDAGPRGINGYPIFYSVGALHADDWKRIYTAVVREQERAKTLDV